MPIKAGLLLLTGGGAIAVWAGLKGKQPSEVLRALVSGKAPGTATTADLIQGTAVSTVNLNDSGSGVSVNPSPGNAVTTAAYKAFAMTLMVKHGWGLGQQWTDFQWIVEHESNWNPRIANSSSGAFGIAQALGHGTANTRGTITNQYGNFGTPDSVCKLANSGNGDAQLIWMCNYIAEKYGSPSHTRAIYNQGY